MTLPVIIGPEATRVRRKGRKPLFGIPPHGCWPKRPVRRIALRASALMLTLTFGSIYAFEGQVEEGTLMKETMLDAEVTYTLEHPGRFYIIERVLARVCQETGEQFFSPEAVERIQLLIKSNKKPDRVIETPVYQYT